MSSDEPQDGPALDDLLAERGLDDKYRTLFENVDPARWQDHADALTRAGVGGGIAPHVRLAREALAHAAKVGNPNGGEMALMAKAEAKNDEKRRRMFGETGGEQ